MRRCVLPLLLGCAIAQDAHANTAALQVVLAVFCYFGMFFAMVVLLVYGKRHEVGILTRCIFAAPVLLGIPFGCIGLLGAGAYTGLVYAMDLSGFSEGYKSGRVINKQLREQVAADQGAARSLLPVVEGEGTFAVVLAGLEAHYQDLAEVASEVAGIGLTDAKTRVKRTPGLPLRNIDGQIAANVASALAARGIRAAAVDEELLPGRGRAVRIRRASVQADGLLAQLPGGEQLLPWSALVLIGIGRLGSQKLVRPGRDAVQRQLTPGSAVASTLAAGRDRLASSEVATLAGTPLVVDLLFDQPPMIARIQTDGFNYRDALEQVAQSSALNAHALLAAIVRRAPDASVSPQTAAFLEGSAISEFVFSQLRQLEEYHRWLMLAAMAFAPAE